MDNPMDTILLEGPAEPQKDRPNVEKGEVGQMSQFLQ